MGYQRSVGDGVDLRNYAWVDTYLKGLKYQEKIKPLKDEIEGIRKFPRAKTEILEELKQIGERVKAQRVADLGEIFTSFQNGEISAITPYVLAQVHIVPNGAMVSRSHTTAHDFDSLLAPGIVEKALNGLPEGMTIAEKEAKIANLETKIKGLETKMADECWPESRKVFDDKGKPQAGQDRWQEVVDHWRKVAAPYNKPVDFRGFAAEQGSPAWEAFRKLGFRLFGTATPRPR